MSNSFLQRRLNLASSLLATAIRGSTGINTKPATKKPSKTLELFDMEGCPYCRLVREALTELDLDAIIYPCPKNGERYRPQVVEMGGKAQFPYLVDPNTGKQMYESLDIVEYLFETYGERSLPLKWRVGALQTLGSMFASASRLGQGIIAREANTPAENLELYSFENSPFARPVREKLCELEIPYVLRSTGRNSARDWVPPSMRDALSIEPGTALENRKNLLDRAGRVSIPYLIDTNTDTEMFESVDMLDYLEETYAVA
ncbi:MAG: glutathione S-transferase N-terminal domain-containing protein [Pseudomonadales bacterium]